ncbi:MAG: hypothetical protein Q7T30_00655 [Planctomycetota bacterium]|nr:hypothetical protein [Planctomycetota bacterium]
MRFPLFASALAAVAAHSGITMNTTIHTACCLLLLACTTVAPALAQEKSVAEAPKLAVSSQGEAKRPVDI